MSSTLGHDHPEFVLTMYPMGIMSLAVCWDSTNVREIAGQLREIADNLDKLPEDTTAEGIIPL